MKKIVFVFLTIFAFMQQLQAVTTSISFKKAINNSYEHAISDKAYSIKPETVKVFINDNKPNYLIIDIRDSEDFEKGMIKNSVPLSESTTNRKKYFKELEAIRNDTKVFILCDTGKRAALLANELTNGYPNKDIYFVLGGFKALSKVVPNALYVPNLVITDQNSTLEEEEEEVGILSGTIRFFTGIWEFFDGNDEDF